MSREKTLQAILSSDAYWGRTYGGGSRSSSWPECGAIPVDNSPAFPNSSFETADDLTEDTVVVYHVNEEGHVEVLSRDRVGEESLESFKARVAVVLGETALPPALEES